MRVIKKTRSVFLRLALGGIAGILLARPVISADQTPASDSGDLKIKGCLNARYAYVGSSSAATVYSGMRITGSLQLSTLSDKAVLKYRSHHWLSFDRPQNSFLESPFENRHIIQTVSIETDGLLARGLKLRMGRFFPEMDYAASPVIDGGAFAFELGRFSVGGSAGRMVDSWNGKNASGDILSAAELKYRTGRIKASAGFQNASFSGIKGREVPAGFNVILKKDVWLETYAAYDFEAKELTRTGLSLSLRRGAGSLSLMASQWRNPFDQLSILDKGRNLAYRGFYPQDAPATYRDIDVSGSINRSGWGVRAALGFMSGVRSGWLTSAYLTTPSLLGFNASLGGQSMKSDYIEFSSLDVAVMAQVSDVAVQLESQSRNYEWLPKLSGFRTKDNYSEISVEYPLIKHLSLSAAAGGFFRNLGNEGFKAQAELRLIARI